MVGRSHAAFCQVAFHARFDFVHLVIAQASHRQNDGRPDHEQDQSRQSARLVDEEQRDEAERGRDAIQHEDHATLRPAARQQHVMHVLTVSLKDRLSAEEAANHRECSINHGQPEGHQRNRNRHRRRSLLRALQRERGEREADEKRAGISQED